MVIGIDIGGSKIRGILWNGSLVLKFVEYKTPETAKQFIEICDDLIKELGNGKDIKKIGIGVAGLVRGTIVARATNISYFKNFDFKKIFPESSLRVDNDAKTYARAEYTLGAGKGARSILVVTIGTGIGRAYGEGGKIFNIEKFGKEEAWEREYQKINGKNIDTKLAKYLAKNISPIIKRYGPETVIFGGGVVTRKGFFQKLEKEFESLASKFKLRKSKLGKDAGAVGAAMLWD